MLINRLFCIFLLLCLPFVAYGQDEGDAPSEPVEEEQIEDPEEEEFENSDEEFPPDEEVVDEEEDEVDASDAASFPIPEGEIEKEPPPYTPIPTDYHIKIGDKFLMSVYGEDETERIVTVSPTGAVTFLFIPSFPAVNKTIEELRRDLTTELATYYKEPVLSLTAIGFNGPHYTLIGDVITPGRKPIIGAASLLSALSEMGGPLTQSFRNFTIDVIDYNHSFLWSEGRYVPVNMERLIKYGDLSQNVPLKDGDYIHLGSLVFPKVYVVGEVIRPLSLNYLGTKTLAQAVAEAGGVTLKASSRAVVIRGSLDCPTAYYIDLNRILKAYACDFILEPGDIVYIPPFRFWRLKEIVQEGITAFVSIAASNAGTNTYLSINPAARVDGVETPVPVIPVVTP